jgi:hypothetical protein
MQVVALKTQLLRTITGDAIAVREVVYTLVDNAVRFVQSKAAAAKSLTTAAKTFPID